MARCSRCKGDRFVYVLRQVPGEKRPRVNKQECPQCGGVGFLNLPRKKKVEEPKKKRPIRRVSTAQLEKLDWFLQTYGETFPGGRGQKTSVVQKAFKTGGTYTKALREEYERLGYGKTIQIPNPEGFGRPWVIIIRYDDENRGF